MSQHNLGTFEVSSSKLKVSDPCYDNTPGHGGDIQNVRNGKWKAVILKGDTHATRTRVAELIVFHDSISMPSDSDFEPYKNDEIEVGVDSGQAGFYDYDRWVKDGCGQGEYEDHSSFYGKVCQLTLNSPDAGIIDNFGAVSASGFGDGCYKVDVVTQRDLTLGDVVVAARVIFIDDDEEEGL